MAAVTVKELPEGDEWLYEPKLDGYRALLLKNGDAVQVLSRNQKDLTQIYPGVAAAGLDVTAKQAMLDGEIVALSPDGRPSFQALQHRSSHARHRIVFYVFDLLHLNGKDLTSQPLSKRQAQLPNLIEGNSTIRLTADLPGTVGEIVGALRAAGVEGVIAKRRNSTYQPGERSSDWVKLKLEQQQEFVIGGYRTDGSTGLDALLVGFYKGKALQFAGKVRAGFIPHVRREVVEKLRPLITAQCPFANLPDERRGHWGSGVTTEDMAEMRWTKPSLVAQIRFTEWTADNRLRHAAFLGLRTDKSPKDVRKEA